MALGDVAALLAAALEVRRLGLLLHGHDLGVRCHPCCCCCLQRAVKLLVLALAAMLLLCGTKLSWVHRTRHGPAWQLV